MAQQGQGEGTIDPAVLDDIINRLLEFRHARPGKQVQLMETEIRQLCTVSREIFLQQPNLLDLEAPIKICAGRASAFKAPVAFNQVEENIKSAMVISGIVTQ